MLHRFFYRGVWNSRWISVLFHGFGNAGGALDLAPRRGRICASSQRRASHVSRETCRHLPAACQQFRRGCRGCASSRNPDSYSQTAETDLDWTLLLVGAFFAGLVDSIVGGGGLIQLPLLLATFPGMAAPTLFGTNKIASIVGTSLAAWRYMHRIRLNWTMLAPAACGALLAAYFGALTVAIIPPKVLKPLTLALLIAVALYIFRRKEFGAENRQQEHGRRDHLLAVFFGTLIGFYDGFFGPGTGSFLIFVFIRLFGWDFLHASAAAKVVNLATNLGALAYFLDHGQVLPQLGLAMAAANFCGAWAGSHLALTRGTHFVRKVFLCVVTLLILKLFYDLVF
ncbi:MAG: TSUP family transporter [Rhodocyclaceae bacterium]|nr:TSUP family transporter [Rhodocyclaceae bacterium]MBX3669547.1 TSUP family transporter [Rhodocyclaceae bacterium]